jgi:ribosomal protein L24E
MKRSHLLLIGILLCAVMVVPIQAGTQHTQHKFTYLSNAYTVDISTTSPYITPVPHVPTPVWTRKDLGDIATAAAEPVVMYEGNPQILLGNDLVFKMWGHTTIAGVPSTGYAESLDGETWYNYSHTILTGHTCIFVLKQNSTYYMYATKSSWAAFDLYSSPDGVNWTMLKDTTLGTGSGWDSSAVGNIFVWVENSTWYMIYEAKSGSSWHLGLATSSDGQTWSKSASNPVISTTGSNGGPEVHKVGSTYWLWGQQSVSGDLPTDINRYYSTDLVHWTNYPVGVDFSRSTLAEGNQSTIGQVGDPTIIEVNGKTHMWFTYTANQLTGGLGHAVANMTIAQLVETDEVSV